MKTRVCTKCGEEKPETEEYFYRAKSCRGGLCTICKECIKEKNRRWDAENPEKVRERNRRWEDKNPEKVREYKRRWRDKNLEKARESERRWRAENPEKQREKDRRCRNTLVPTYLKRLISAKYDIDWSEIGNELIEAKRREITYYRQFKQLKQLKK
jgi:hypothetical protein